MMLQEDVGRLRARLDESEREALALKEEVACLLHRVPSPMKRRSDDQLDIAPNLVRLKAAKE